MGETAPTTSEKVKTPKTPEEVANQVAKIQAKLGERALKLKREGHLDGIHGTGDDDITYENGSLKTSEILRTSDGREEQVTTETGRNDSGDNVLKGDTSSFKLGEVKLGNSEWVDGEFVETPTEIVPTSRAIATSTEVNVNPLDGSSPVARHKYRESVTNNLSEGFEEKTKDDNLEGVASSAARVLAHQRSRLSVRKRSAKSDNARAVRRAA